MQNRFDIQSAPMPPLRAEPRHPPAATPTGGMPTIEATAGGLIRTTLGSLAAAAAILVFFYIPAEYGIDPTGVGGLLGLTEMGEIKAQLALESAADEELAAQPIPTVPPPVATTEVLDRLTAIESQLAMIVSVISADRVAADPAVPEPETAAPLSDPVVTPVVTQEDAAPAEPPAPLWRDEVSYALLPGEGIEVKLVMQQGETASFEWTANGGAVNFETHGDDGGTNRITYEEGRAIPEQAGTLTAAFAGNHGWFWRNRTDAPVTLTLRTGGAYQEMRAP
jgi:hypothetical protein